MPLYSTSDELLYNLEATTSSEAKRKWRQSVKDKWNNECVYCGSKNNLTVDHVIPRSKGGTDFSTNVVCCCESCNFSKSHNNWEEWYRNQNFFSEERKRIIEEWVNGEKKQNLYTYGKRKNICY